MQPTFNTKKTALAIAVALTLAAGLAACGGGSSDDNDSTPVVSATEMRAATLLDKQNWKFIQDDNLTEAAALSNDGSTWSTVNLPHTWNAKDAASAAQTTPTSKDYKRGKGWYRLEFNNTGTGGTQWLQFDGASIVADVWLNGEKLGQHKGAFTAFRFDVTGKLKAGSNVLLVKADNSNYADGSSLTAIAPLAGDFNMSGGLYRSVSLVSTPNAAHFALDDLGSSGVYARTMSVANGAATVNVRAKLKNDTKTDGSFTVQAALVDASGKTAVVAQKAGVAIKAGAAAEAAQDLVVANARLWNGLADPYLYKLVVELKDSAGGTIDKVVQDFGIRTMRFDAAKGFFLNGKSVPLRGVNMHQDFQDKAWAISNEDTDLSLGLIKEVGANTIRLAHYPHGQYTLQQSDKLGFVVWAELPFVNQTMTAADCKKTSTVPTAFSDNLKLQLQELIRQQYNHASIGMWSLANEVGTNAMCQGKDTVTPMLKELNALARTEDPGRVTTEADSMEDTEGADTSQGSVFSTTPFRSGGITDTWALNRYFGFYFGPTANPLASVLDQLHARYPNQPVGISEYGAGAAITQHTDNVKGGTVCSFDLSGKRRTCYQPEDHANWIHEESYKIMDREYVWGTYVWNMFDFGSGIRHEGDIGGTNTKGLVTFDRRTKKDAFFFYKANWSKEPVTYIAARRYTDRAYPITDVKVYSNASSVSLKVNGSTIGTADCTKTKRICEFKNVPLKAGANSIVAEGSHSGKAVADSVSWNLAADNAANVYIAAGQLATGFISSTGKRYGSDNFFTGGVGESNFPISLAGTFDFTPISGGAIASDARDLALYDQIRVSQGTAPFSYNIPIANGSYQVTLGFLEPSKTMTIGGRVFDVDANGANVIKSLDVLAEAGGKYRTVITPKTFTVAVTTGKLNLDFKPVVGGAVISNITVVRQ